MAARYKTRKTVEKKIDLTDHSSDKSKSGANRQMRHPMESVARQLTDRNRSGDVGKNALPTILTKAAENNPALAKQTLIGLQHRFGNQYVQRIIDLQRKEESDDAVTSGMEQAIQSKRGGGQPMDNATRQQMEGAFGQDFKNVRIHSDGEADSLNRSLSARAFTTGKDIFFKQGEYDTAVTEGRKLLAHELTHVVQQTGETRLKMKVSTPNDRYEQEADQMAREVIQRDQQKFQSAMKPDQLHRQVEEEEEELQTKRLILKQEEDEEVQLKEQIEKGEEIRRQSGEEGETTGQRPTKKTDVPEEYQQRRKEEWLDRARAARNRVLRLMKAPYNPGVMSKRYHMLPTEQQTKVIKIVDDRFQWEFPGVTWKLNWEDPGDRPLARVWLRIRDRVMARVWPSYVKSLSKRTKAEIDRGLKAFEEKQQGDLVREESPEKRYTVAHPKGSLTKEEIGRWTGEDYVAIGEEEVEDLIARKGATSAVPIRFPIRELENSFGTDFLENKKSMVLLESGTKIGNYTFIAKGDSGYCLKKYDYIFKDIVVIQYTSPMCANKLGLELFGNTALIQELRDRIVE